jgi:hypothetical protein
MLQGPPAHIRSELLPHVNRGAEQKMKKERKKERKKEKVRNKGNRLKKLDRGVGLMKG